MVTLSLHDTLTITATTTASGNAGNPATSNAGRPATSNAGRPAGRPATSTAGRPASSTAGGPAANAETSPDTATYTGTPHLTATGPYSVGMPLDHTNLICRALRLANMSASIHVDKQIPHGGGLGGGSSDAAAVLRWAGYSDLAGASTIGADVPFCLIGGRARVCGIGEHVEPLPFLERRFTLIIPPLEVSTPAVYAAWDALGGPTADGVNDLEPAAIIVEPELAWWRDHIGNATGQTPVLAGSGATWFVDGVHDNALAAMSNEGAKVVVVTTTPSSQT
jgi:4-diphosphocytidyl-2-C-methyl-D-erythritol kinase